MSWEDATDAEAIQARSYQTRSLSAVDYLGMVHCCLVSSPTLFSTTHSPIGFSLYILRKLEVMCL